MLIFSSCSKQIVNFFSYRQSPDQQAKTVEYFKEKAAQKKAEKEAKEAAKKLVS